LFKDLSVEGFISVILKNPGPKNGLGELIGIFHDHGFLFIEQALEIEGVLIVVFGELGELEGDSFG
jgi:hypothetical protein